MLQRTLQRTLARLTRAKKNHVEALHFDPLTDAGRAARLFKKSVRAIELEISSYCNRVCSYCPNALYDRRSEQTFMDDGVFDNIVRALNAIDYQGAIRLHRYNEPLADRDYAMKRIGQIRSALPRARLEIFTNADYLRHDFVRELADAGCAKIHATAHVNWDTFDAARAHDHLCKLLDKLDYPYALETDNGSEIAYRIALPGVDFTYNMVNFMSENELGNTMANDRGGALDIQSNFQRTQPCMRLFDELQVDFQGNLLPCCHLRGDIPGNEKYILGAITADNDLFLQWANANYAAWRRDMISYDLKRAPCTHCDYKLTGENKKLRAWERYVQDRHRKAAS